MDKEKVLLKHLEQFTHDNTLEAYYIQKNANELEKLYDIKVDTYANSITYSYFFFDDDTEVDTLTSEHTMDIESFFNNYIPKNYTNWKEYMFVHGIKGA